MFYLKIVFYFVLFFSLQDMLGELFTPIETPEAQNRGFLKGFFGGNAHTFDREELCVYIFFIAFNSNLWHNSNVHCI